MLRIRLELAAQNLTNVTASGSSFVFYINDAEFSTVTAAELASETQFNVSHNSLQFIPAALFQALQSATVMCACPKCCYLTTSPH